MSRPQRVSSKEILDVARMHFTARGDSASIKSIAQDLGLTHSAILQRFGSKRELMIRSLKPPADYPWPENFFEGPHGDEQEAIEQLRLTCEMIRTFLQKYFPQVVILQAAGVQPRELFGDRFPLPLIACQRLREWIDRGVQRGVFNSCDSAAVASTIVGTMFARNRLETIFELSHLDGHQHSDESQATSELELDRSSLLGTSEEVMNLFSMILINKTSPSSKSVRLKR